MNEELKEFESMLKDYISQQVRENEDNTLIMNNIMFFAMISDIVVDVLEPIKDKLKYKGMFDNLPVYSVEERLNIFKQFASYAHLGSPKFIEELIDRGVISLEGDIYNNSTERNTNEDELINGSMHYYEDIIDYIEEEDSYFILSGSSFLQSLNTGFLVDSMVLSHELSHYLDYINGNPLDNDVDKLLSESTAIVIEMIFNNYIENDHERDAYVNKIIRLSHMLKDAELFSNIVDFIYMYNKCGDISLDTYRLIGGNEELYIRKLNFLKNYKGNTANLFFKIPYVLAGCLSPYMFMKYRENEKYLSKIDSLHEEKDDLLKVFEYLELPTNERDLLDTFRNSLKDYVDYVFYDKKKKSKL